MKKFILIIIPIILFSLFAFTYLSNPSMQIKPYSLSKKEEAILKLTSNNKGEIYQYHVNKNIAKISVDILDLDKDGNWKTSRSLIETSSDSNFNDKVFISYDRSGGDFMVSFQDKNLFGSTSGKLSGITLNKNEIDRVIKESNKLTIIENEPIPLLLFFEQDDNIHITDMQSFYDTEALKKLNNVQCLTISFLTK